MNNIKIFTNYKCIVIMFMTNYNIKLWKRKVDRRSFYRDLSKGGSLKFDTIEGSSGAINWNNILL